MKRTILVLIVAVVVAGPALAQNPCMPGMIMPGCPPAAVPGQAAAGDTHPTMTLQEPENPARRTGADLPAPQLLNDVSQRPAMSLADFESLAEANNPTLKQANDLVRRSQGQARQAGLYPNPSVGYQGEQIRGGSFGGGEQGAFVQQTIILGGKLGLRRSISEEESKSDRIGLEEQTGRVRGDVQQAFYATLTAQEEVRLRRRLLGVALDAVETVHQLANVGQADAPDILQTEVEAEQAKVDDEAAQRQYLSAFHSLASMAGKADIPVSPLQGELEKLPDLNADEIVERIVSDSPTVRRAVQELAIAQARLKDAKREMIPDLQLRAGEQYNFEHVGTISAQAAGPQSFATAGIQIPLWNRNQGNIEAAKSDGERAEHAVALERLRLRNVAVTLAQSYLSARFETDRYKNQLIPRALRAYQLYLEKYRSMAQAYPQVLVSQRTLFQLQISYVNALHRAWQSALALENSTLSGALDSPLSRGSATGGINLPGSGGTLD